jgi:hypothetical protein
VPAPEGETPAEEAPAAEKAPAAEATPATDEAPAAAPEEESGGEG